MQTVEGSAILTGDSDAATWRYGILQDYDSSQIATNFLLAGHHGSITFFDDPADEKFYFQDHVAAMKPAMVIISVGPNSYGHPDEKAMEMYRKHATGSNKGRKLVRTDREGTKRLTLKNGGGWNLS